MKRLTSARPRDYGPAWRSPDKLFIAVLTNPRDSARRTAVRETWKTDADKHPNVYKVKFMACSRGVEQAHLTRLYVEDAEFNDVSMLDCFEGYGEGNLTRKVLAAMQYFTEKE